MKEKLTRQASINFSQLLSQPEALTQEKLAEIAKYNFYLEDGNDQKLLQLFRDAAIPLQKKQEYLPWLLLMLTRVLSEQLKGLNPPNGEIKDIFENQLCDQLLTLTVGVISHLPLAFAELTDNQATLLRASLPIDKKHLLLLKGLLLRAVKEYPSYPGRGAAMFLLSNLGSLPHTATIETLASVMQDVSFVQTCALEAGQKLFLLAKSYYFSKFNQAANILPPQVKQLIEELAQSLSHESSQVVYIAANWLMSLAQQTDSVPLVQQTILTKLTEALRYKRSNRFLHFSYTPIAISTPVELHEILYQNVLALLNISQISIKKLAPPLSDAPIKSIKRSDEEEVLSNRKAILERIVQVFSEESSKIFGENPGIIEYGQEEDTQQLINDLYNPWVWVRTKALEILKKLNQHTTIEVITALRRNLGSKVREIRQFAADSLIDIKPVPTDEKVIIALQKNLRESAVIGNWRDWQAAWQGFERLKEQNRPEILKEVEDSLKSLNWSIRQRAVKILMSLGPEKKAVIQQALQSKEMHDDVAKWLTQLTNEYVGQYQQEKNYWEKVATLLDSVFTLFFDNNNTFFYDKITIKALSDKYLRQEVKQKGGITVRVKIFTCYLLVKLYYDLSKKKTMDLWLEKFVQAVENQRIPSHYRLLSYVYRYIGQDQKAQRALTDSLELENTSLAIESERSNKDKSMPSENIKILGKELRKTFHPPEKDLVLDEAQAHIQQNCKVFTAKK